MRQSKFAFRHKRWGRMDEVRTCVVTTSTKGVGGLMSCSPIRLFRRSDVHMMKRKRRKYSELINRPSQKQLFVLGNNKNGVLGLGDETVDETITDPTELNAPDGTTWAQIACGWCHTAAVSSNGDLLTWGSGTSGKLGHGDWKWDNRHAPTEVEIPGGEAVVKVACGRWHTAAVTSTGKLFTWYVRSCYLILDLNIWIILD